MERIPNVLWPWKLCDELTENFLHRAFAVWCAKRAWRHAGCRPCEPVVMAVESYLRVEIPWKSVRQQREKRRGGVAGAGVVGVPKGFPSAAAQIAAWHTADDVSLDAAKAVIHHTALAAGFAALKRVSEQEEAAYLTVVGELHTRLTAGLQARRELMEASQQAENVLLVGELHRWLSRRG
jgi:hypothetical protein